jgi:probable addiction module antidote protein
MTRKAKAITGRLLGGSGPVRQPERSGGNPAKRQGCDNRSAVEGIPRSASGATRDAGQPVHHCRNFAVAYLNVLIDDADQEELIAALGRIARLSGGEKLVEKVELNAPALYRALCRRGNPELKSVATLLKALGIRMALQPLEEAASQLPRTRRFTRPDEEGAYL